MEKQYQQLQPEERLTIASMHLQGSSMRAMARMLGRSPATVSRELARNCRFENYASIPAQALSVARRIAARPPARLDPKGVTWRIVLTLLDWSVSRTQARACDAVPKMEEGLPMSACRSRYQTAQCGCVQKAWS